MHEHTLLDRFAVLIKITVSRVADRSYIDTVHVTNMKKYAEIIHKNRHTFHITLNRQSSPVPDYLSYKTLTIMDELHLYPMTP